MTRRRLVLYLLLNALVSIVVSGAILFIYDRAYHKTDCGTGVTIPTLVADDVKIDIVSISGTGVLASETVVIQNNGSETVLLTGWTLKDNEGNIYTFPQLSLYPGGTVQVHTGSGKDTASDLYWQRSSPVWESGILAALYDTQNIARAFFRVP